MKLNVLNNQPDCVSNLRICNASCCRTLSFRVQVTGGKIHDRFIFATLTEDKKHYFELHNCKVKKLPDRSYEVFLPKRITSTDYKYSEIKETSTVVEVPVICSALTKDNKCSLHGTKEKPNICTNLTHETAHDYHITDGCIFENE